MTTIRFSITILMLLVASSGLAETGLEIQRLPGNPVLTTESSPSIGDNINGPSVIRVPDWVEAPLGKYYLYFAHHKGKHIRLAYADAITGPWTVHEPGVLDLEHSGFATGVIPADDLPEAQKARVLESRQRGDDPLYTHIASPDALVVPEHKQVRLYFHGRPQTGPQATRVAISSDGINFKVLPDLITRAYLRVFRLRGSYYGLAMPGVLYRSVDGLTNFMEGAQLFPRGTRHFGLMPAGDILRVFFSRAGDAPEHILVSTIDTSGDWTTWKASPPVEVLRSHTEWEGASLPIEPSRRGAIVGVVNQLRDPAIFTEGGETWLFYTVAGETGIAVAKVLTK